MPAPASPAARAGGFLLLLALLPLTLLPAHAAPTVRFDLSGGAKVSDVAVIVVRVSGDSDVQKVDFTVDGQAKASDSSIPYSFDWDTLNETEGEHTLTATATDEKGETGAATLKVVVDNELGKGADYHADAALAALKAGDTKTAANAARRALKIQPSNLRAARALAGLYRQQGDLDRAIALLEKAEIPDSDTEARADLTALYIAKADAAESTAEFLQAAQKAVDLYRKLQAARAAASANTGPEAALQRGDQLFAARNWQAAINEYQKTGNSETAPVPALNRLLLAYLNMGRNKDADILLRDLTSLKRGDEVTGSLTGMNLLANHQAARARTAVQAGVDGNQLPALIIAAYADLSQRQRAKAQEEAEKAAALAPDLPEVLLLQAYVLPDPLDARKALGRALERDPLLLEAYALRGYQTMLTRDEKRYEAADSLFEFALKLDPKNLYGLFGRALSLLAQNRPNEAEPFVTQIVTQDPDAPDGHVLRALLYQLQDKPSNLITEELETARKQDEEHWNAVFVPKPAELIRDVYRYRFSPALSPAALYPAK